LVAARGIGYPAQTIHTVLLVIRCKVIDDVMFLNADFGLVEFAQHYLLFFLIKKVTKKSRQIRLLRRICRGQRTIARTAGRNSVAI
jgi:hypothetical protein